MKKTKLLMPILGISTIAATAIPLASCNNNGGGGKTETASLTSIAVKANPEITDFTVGDTFKSIGLIITAKYSDNTSKDFGYGTTGLSTNYDGTTFTDEDVGENKDVTVSYKENNITKTTTYKINVKEGTIKVNVDTEEQMGTVETLRSENRTFEVGKTYSFVIAMDKKPYVKQSSGYYQLVCTDQDKTVKLLGQYIDTDNVTVYMDGEALPQKSGENWSIKNQGIVFGESLSYSMTEETKLSIEVTFTTKCESYYIYFVGNTPE